MRLPLLPLAACALGTRGGAAAFDFQDEVRPTPAHHHPAVAFAAPTRGAAAGRGVSAVWGDAGSAPPPSADTLAVRRALLEADAGPQPLYAGLAPGEQLSDARVVRAIDDGFHAAAGRLLAGIGGGAPAGGAPLVPLMECVMPGRGVRAREHASPLARQATWLSASFD